MTTAPVISTAVTTAVSTTSTATSSPTSSDLLNGQKEQQPQVNVSLMFLRQMDAVHVKLAEKANLNPTGQAKAKGKGFATEEPMQNDSAITSSRQTRQSGHTTEKTPRSRYLSTTRGHRWEKCRRPGLLNLGCF